MNTRFLFRTWIASVILTGSGWSQMSAARQFNEECLDAIRIDFPAPTVHARNLFHCSAAMYDAWAAYDGGSAGLFHNEAATAEDPAAARWEAVSYAAYRVLHARYSSSVNSAATLAALDLRMDALGFDAAVETIIGVSPASVGNRCAAAVLSQGLTDGSNEAGGYASTVNYLPVNAPLVLLNSGTGGLVDPNRWQPLAFDEADNVQAFLTPHWGGVTPFALFDSNDPVPPPFLGGVGDPKFKENNLEVIRYSSHLDADSPEVVDISPGSYGNSELGTNDGAGHALNPTTGAPYAANVVNRGDFGRVLAEFWADGPHSETPPGHWNVLANQVADAPGFEKRIGGLGPIVSDLEWDVKVYLVLNGALHDSAIAAWDVKMKYDYVRPITSIRHMGGLGQSSHPEGPSYHPDGLPLATDLVEVVSSETTAPGQRHEGLTIGTLAIKAWHDDLDGPDTSGVDWISASDWTPYQRATFVTPPFAGYVSGHSTFSRAAAEVLTAMTGSPYFPGGLGAQTVSAGALQFESGPEEDLELQWATYFDAADQAGLSRIYGGIHVEADDLPGRRLGSQAGLASVRRALDLFQGSALSKVECSVARLAEGITLTWPCLANFQYQVQVSSSLAPDDFTDLTTMQGYSGPVARFVDPDVSQGKKFYRIVRAAP